MRLRSAKIAAYSIILGHCFFFASLVSAGPSNTDEQALNVKLCTATAEIVVDAAKSRDAGESEAAYLARQGVNASDDIEDELVHLAYEQRGMPTQMLRDNVFDQCVRTEEWTNCKPLTPKTGIACFPPNGD